MNIVSVTGRLVSDVESRISSSGVTVAFGTIAVDHFSKGQKGVYFFDITILGKTADRLMRYLRKGQQIGVSGELQQDRWEKDGKKNSKIKILANSIDLLGGKSITGSEQDSDVDPDSIPF
jgi:single-strand DNA-binding protein